MNTNSYQSPGSINSGSAPARPDSPSARGRFGLTLGILLVMVAFGAVMRLVPHPWNCTPMAAIALFAGAHFGRKVWAFVVPLAAMLVSDTLLFVIDPARGFHRNMPFVYASLAAIVGLGLLLQHRRRVLPVLGAAVGGSLLFFVVTNFGFWLLYDLDPKTWEGLAACYVRAIPFYRQTLAGDLAFTALLFGAFALAERRFPVFARPQPARAVNR